MSLVLKGKLKPGQPDRRYYMIRVQVDNRRVPLSAGTRDRKLAEKKEQLVVDALNANPGISKAELIALVRGKDHSLHKAAVRVGPARVQLGDAAKRCFRDPEVWGQIKSRDAHKANISRLIGYFGEEKYLDEIGKDELKGLTTHLIDKCHLSPGGADRILAVTSRLLRASTEWPDGPKSVPRVKLLKRSKPRMYVLSAEHEKKLFNAVLHTKVSRPRGPNIDGHHCLQLFRVLLETGMRLGEALNLRWEDIVVSAGTKQIRLWRRDELKTSASVRTIPLTEECSAALEELRHVPEGPFKTLTDARAQRAWRMAKKDAGITNPDCVIHSLRHTCATRLLEAVGDIKLVQEWLGHSTIATTARIYAHVPTHRLVDAAGALEKLRGTSPAS